MSEPTAISVQIAKLEVSAGDVLVMKIERHISGETAGRLREMAIGYVPDGVMVMVIDKDISLAVLTQKEIAERAA
jgi:hypothetical protein